MVTYQDYLRYFVTGSEASSAPMGENEWNALSEDDKWGSVNDSVIIEPNDPRYENFSNTVNPEDPRPVWVFSTRNGGSILNNDPTTGNTLVVDPNRVTRGEGWEATPWDNGSPTMQSRGENLLNRFLLSAALMVAGGYAGGAFSGAADGAGQMAAGAGQGFGTSMGGGAADIIYGASAGAGTVGSGATGSFDMDGSRGVFDANGNPLYNSPAPTQTQIPQTPQGPAPSGPPATQPPAPVTNATPTPTPTTTGGGILDTARNAWSSTSGWYNGLSPAGRMVVNGVISQGVQGLAGANAQREVQQENERREEEQRQDRIRRTSIPAFGSAFTPRGIINGTRRPGG